MPRPSSLVASHWSVVTALHATTPVPHLSDFAICWNPLIGTERLFCPEYTAISTFIGHLRRKWTPSWHGSQHGLTAKRSSSSEAVQYVTHHSMVFRSSRGSGSLDRSPRQVRTSFDKPHCVGNGHILLQLAHFSNRGLWQSSSEEALQEGRRA